jgi:hypothetical protein
MVRSRSYMILVSKLLIAGLVRPMADLSSLVQTGPTLSRLVRPMADLSSLVQTGPTLSRLVR